MDEEDESHESQWSRNLNCGREIVPMLSGVEYLCGLQRSSYQVTTRNGVNIGTQIIPGSAKCLYLNKQ